MSDLLGLLFFALLIIGIFVGLKILSKPQKQTAKRKQINTEIFLWDIGQI